MQAKQVNGQLVCLMSEFEARLLKDMLGQISFSGIPYGDPGKSAVVQMCDCFGDQGVYFTTGIFDGKVNWKAHASNSILEALAEEGWATQHMEEQ